jgi:hypothetical protein
MHSRITDLRKKIIVLKYKIEHPCQECGESNPVLLEFHHIHPNTKHPRLRANNSHRRLVGLSISQLIKEIQKCSVLCVRCHRLETAKKYAWPTLDELEIEYNKIAIRQAYVTKDK